MPDLLKELLGLAFDVARSLVDGKLDEAEEQTRRLLIKLEARKAWHRDG